MKRLKAIGIVSAIPSLSNPDLFQERDLSRMAFLLIPVKEELISVREFIESLRTHVTLILVLSPSHRGRERGYSRFETKRISIGPLHDKDG